MRKKRIAVVCAVIVGLVAAFFISYYWAKGQATEERKNVELVADKNILPPVAVEKITDNQIGGDTQYVFDIYNLTTQTHMEKKAVVPPECIGMTREEFITYLSKYEQNPSAEEKQKGFCNCSLLSFSNNQDLSMWYK